MGNLGIMEKKMETTTMTVLLLFRRIPKIPFDRILELLIALLSVVERTRVLGFDMRG